MCLCRWPGLGDRPGSWRRGPNRSPPGAPWANHGAAFPPLTPLGADPRLPVGRMAWPRRLQAYARGPGAVTCLAARGSGRPWRPAEGVPLGKLRAVKVPRGLQPRPATMPYRGGVVCFRRRKPSRARRPHPDPKRVGGTNAGSPALGRPLGPRALPAGFTALLRRFELPVPLAAGRPGDAAAGRLAARARRNRQASARRPAPPWPRADSAQTGPAGPRPIDIRHSRGPGRGGTVGGRFRGLPPVELEVPAAGWALPGRGQTARSASRSCSSPAGLASVPRLEHPSASSRWTSASAKPGRPLPHRLATCFRPALTCHSHRAQRVRPVPRHGPPCGAVGDQKPLGP